MTLATIICPECGHSAEETVPTDSCLYFYKCRGCGVVLRPKAGDCCVFCSYANAKCPSKQRDEENSHG